MGNKNSTFIMELSDDSSDSDFEYSLEPRPNKKTKNTVNDSELISDTNLIEITTNATASNLETDANCTSKEMNLTTDASVKSFPKPELAVHHDEIFEIEKRLEPYEMVSLVYLLYENANFALQELVLFLNGAQKNLLYAWANSEEYQCKPWQKKLIEALCIIKNYQILRTLGYSKKDLTSYFLPRQANAITSLNKVRKAIYLICEKLNQEKTNRFLEIIKLHFSEKSMTFTDTYDQEYLELYFLNWEICGYISMTDMSNIKRALKVMEEELLCDILESVFVTSREKVEAKPKVNPEIEEVKKTPKPRQRSTSIDTHQRVPNSKEESGYFQSSPSSIDQDNVPKFENVTNRYEIDPENPGVILIINQEEFYTEIDETFLDLLPKDIEYNKLEARAGTEKDKDALINTFQNFGFKVVVEDNLTHEDMITAVEKVVMSIRKESSLFVCIMSHGDKGVVYGANSCKVKVRQIKEIMSKKNQKHLLGKPKILILQSCQGKQCQRLNDLDEEEEEEHENCSLTTDGPNTSKVAAPPTVDILTFWATVPGYAAIRNKRTGSWFIQALCNKITELGNKHHFEDICTTIVNDVTDRRWTVHEGEENVMTPIKESTLRKFLYLPQMKKKEPQQEIIVVSF